MLDPKSSLIPAFPHKSYSISGFNDSLYGFTIEKIIENRFILHESLVIFHTNNYKEIPSFIYKLGTQLFARKFPNCLVIYQLNDSRNEYKETKIIKILKFAWDWKFLDFSIIFTGLRNKSTFDSSHLLYSYNPFSDEIQKARVDETTNVFPDKLRNGFGYSLYIPTYFQSLLE